MVLYDEKGARFAQTPLNANESKHTQYNSQRKDNFGSPALASEAILGSQSAVVSSPDLNSLSNEVSRSHLRGLTDKGIMGYENNFQTSENQTSLSFSGDCLNYSQEISQNPKETIPTFDLKEQMQKLNNQENQIFMEDMYQELDQQKDQQDPLSFVNDFLIPSTPYSDENKNENVNYPLNYSNSFLSGTNIERSTNLSVETNETVLPEVIPFKASPATCSSDNIDKKNLQSNEQQQDLQSLLDLLEPPPKKRRGRPPGSKNSDKKNQPANQIKKTPKRKNNIPNQQSTVNSKHSDQQSYRQILPSYSQVSRFTQERSENYLLTKGFVPPVQTQQNANTPQVQQSLGFLQQQNSEFSQHTPLNFTQQSSQFIQQPSGSKTSKFPQQVSSSQTPGFSQLHPNSQTANFSHDFSNSQNPIFSQQIPAYQTCNYSQQQLPKFSQLSASLKSPPQYSEYYGQQSGNVKTHDYGQFEYDQQFQEYRANVSKNNVQYFQAPPNYSDHMFQYAQPFMNYAKSLEYCQNYPHQFYNQPFSNEQLDQVQNFPRSVDGYNQIASQYQGSFQNQRFPTQHQQILSQNQVPLSKQDTSVVNPMSLQNQRYPVQSHQISPQSQVPLQNPCKSGQSKKSSFELNQQITQNHQGPFHHQLSEQISKSPNDTKITSEYDQRMVKNFHFANGESYPIGYHPDSKFFPPTCHTDSLNQQKITETCGTHCEPNKFFRSWHTPEGESKTIHSDSKSLRTNRDGTKIDDKQSTTDYSKNFPKSDSTNFLTSNNSTGFSSMNATNFLKDNTTNCINYSNGFSTMNNTITNYPKFVSNSENLLQEKSSNFHEAGTTQYIKDKSSLPIHQNYADPLNFLGNTTNPAFSSKDGNNFFPSTSLKNFAKSSKKCLEKQFNQSKKNDISKEDNVPQCPNYFQLPNGKCVLSITASWLDAQSRKSENTKEKYHPTEESRDWLVKSPVPLEIICPESEKRKRKRYRTEYRPHKDIKYAVKRYRAKGFSTRSPCPKINQEEKDPLAVDDDDDIDDDDDNIDDHEDDNDNAVGDIRVEKEKEKNEEKEQTREEEEEEEEEGVKDEKKESNDSQDSQHSQDNTEQLDIKNTNSSVQNSCIVLKNCTTTLEEKNLPTAFDIITGRWTRKDGFKKSQIHHQGLPNLQLICKSEFNKTANSKQIKSFKFECKQKQSVTVE